MTNMQITLLTVGKFKDACYRDAAQNYIKRLQHYVAYDEIEVREERAGKNARVSDIIEKEGHRLLSALHPDATVVALGPSGKLCRSEALAKRLNHYACTKKKPPRFSHWRPFWACISSFVACRLASVTFTYDFSARIGACDLARATLSRLYDYQR